MVGKTKLEREYHRHSFLSPSTDETSPPSSPRSLPNAPAKAEEEIDTKAALESRSSFLFYARDFLAASLRLLRNAVFFLLILAYATLMAISAGFAVFLPKFFEVQFGLNASRASTLIGGVQMPFGLLGVLGGGYAMKRFQLSDKKAVGLSVVASVLSLIVGIPLIFVGCETRPIAGLTALISDSTSVGASPLFNSSSASSAPFIPLPLSCSAGCGCEEGKYEPVCASGMEYLTPCHAGCRGVEFNETRSGAGDLKILSFSNCSCLRNESELAMPRPCAHQCEKKLWTGIGISCAVLFIICVIQSPVYIGRSRVGGAVALCVCVYVFICLSVCLCLCCLPSDFTNNQKPSSRF